ncbi:hypothetical protein [Spirilliplanes yamanashiensis]|uniref:PknH-like extracellular domain-containing protein n=1 Tax=Spirilliplanes yamanashiensis TaxID=42233 RepID=A0A8J4DLY3_9ACTN|nr:hypothetical protein [Spirilliplanes yamanashiensis]MDP9819126.1 hypothetical protein [Spirilliplanes yamanashiensis]GIJ05580.1 hypothetical protein Sya03_49320 [Spirilliplanes yamanashiensis]
MRRSLVIPAAALLTSLAVAGCAPAASSEIPAAPSGAAAGVPSQGGAQPSTEPAGPVVPGKALLQPGDLDGATPEKADATFWSYLLPPNACDKPHASDRLRLAAATRQALYADAGAVRPTVVVNHVARYEPGTASRVLAEIKDSVRRCPGTSAGGERRWTVTRTGDKMVMLKIDSDIVYGAPVKHAAYVGVAVVGDGIVVVADAGFEASSGNQKLVDRLLPVAAERAEAMN